MLSTRRIEQGGERRMGCHESHDYTLLYCRTFQVHRHHGSMQARHWLSQVPKQSSPDSNSRGNLPLEAAHNERPMKSCDGWLQPSYPGEVKA